jgi:hypothetical protein
MSVRNPSDSASNSTQEKAPDAALVYRPVEALKAWARDAKNHLPKDKQAELKDLISQIEAGPEAGKPMAIRSLREDRSGRYLSSGRAGGWMSPGTKSQCRKLSVSHRSVPSMQYLWPQVANLLWVAVPEQGDQGEGVVRF